jgi:hypothetical protein
MESYSGVSTPMDPNSHLIAATLDYIASQIDQLGYQQAIGSFIYAMLGTRPDLAFTVSTLSKYCSNPTPKHSIVALQVLRYFQKTTDIGITYGGQENPIVDKALRNSTGLRITSLTGFSDSDWAGDLDTRKSTSGYIFLLYGGAISWKSAKQNIVATSSTEAEYIASSEAAKEALWIRRLLAEIHGSPLPRPTSIESPNCHETDIQDQLEALRITPTSTPPQKLPNPQVIFSDNQGAIKLSRNP